MLKSFIVWDSEPGGYARVERLAEWGAYSVKARAGDTLVRGVVSHDEAGFRGRQWTDDVTGQQHGTLKAAALAILHEAKMREQFRVWLKVNKVNEDVDAEALYQGGYDGNE